jgi:oligopeptide/dipeptide ABC transporter ATP-binding protein
MRAMPEALLELRGLCVHFPVRPGRIFGRDRGLVRAVDGVSLAVAPGEVLGLVGESGCGKSTLARAIVQLVRPTAGEILFEGRNLAGIGRAELRRLRPRLQMIFQDPYASLNPRRTVFDTVAEPMLAHGIVARREATAEVRRLMDHVGLSAAAAHKYPHEFSGGQRQRIAIARALALRPALILADEPVSALDVSVQAQILNLLRALCREMGLTMLLISHDLSVVRHMARRIAVMYLGRIVELGTAAEVFDTPLHPYTRALLSAVPQTDPARRRARILLEGDPPSPLHPPAGCAFHPRCPWAEAACAAAYPAWEAPGLPGHGAACRRLAALPPL